MNKYFKEVKNKLNYNKYVKELPVFRKRIVEIHRDLLKVDKGLQE